MHLKKISIGSRKTLNKKSQRTAVKHWKKFSNNLKMALTITKQPSANSFNASNNHLIYKVQSTVLETVHGELFIDDVNTNVKIKSKESFTAGIATHTFDFSSVADNFITDNQLPS